MMSSQEIERNLLKDMRYIKRIVNNIVMQNENLRRSFDVEDMYQEAYIAYMQACEKYDAEKGASLITFAALNISHRLSEILRKKSLTNTYKDKSLDKLEDMGCYKTMVYTGTEQAEYTAICQQIDERLQIAYKRTKNKTHKCGIMAIRSRLNAELLNEFYDNKKMAKELNISTKYLSVCVQRVKTDFLYDILKDVLGETEFVLKK